MKKLFVTLIAVVGFGICVFALSYGNEKVQEEIYNHETCSQETCNACNNVGYFVCAETFKGMCNYCSGRGTNQDRNGNTVKCTFQDCNGTGKITKTCDKCYGTGKRDCKSCRIYQ